MNMFPDILNRGLSTKDVRPVVPQKGFNLSNERLKLSDTEVYLNEKSKRTVYAEV